MKRIDNELPKGLDGEALMVYGEMSVGEYKKEINGTYKRVEVLPVSPAVLDELSRIPNGRLELHPRVSVPGILDLVPTVSDPRLRLPVFQRRDIQRAEKV